VSGFVILVHFDLRDGAFDEFLRLVSENARASVADEPGCRRFDVLVPEGQRNRVTLYEIYDDRAAFEAHLRTAHFQRFDAATEALIASKEVIELSLHLEPSRGAERAAGPGAA
jgi:(4S)-4-hydroxy-5-phosphonooxypentane-2,3-dione isomerase